MKVTAVFHKVPEGYVGFVEELPGANTHSATLKEARENLTEVVQMVLEANRHLAEELCLLGLGQLEITGPVVRLVQKRNSKGERHARITDAGKDEP